MPRRKVVLVTSETYHIFNRSLRNIPIFTNKKEFELFLLATKFYLQPDPPVKFSIYRQQKEKYQIDLSQKLVKIIAYCLMPNHFHFILTQIEENGIKEFIRKLSSSYSHYFNIKHEQRGPVFEGKFKAVRVETQEQLLHLSRYIHLNPVTSFIVEDPLEYDYSSYKAYLKNEDTDFLDNSVVMTEFSSPKKYGKFVLDRKDYQRELEAIKHIILE